MLDRLTHQSRQQAEARRARDRRYAQRQRDGKIIAPVEVDAAVLDMLIRLAWLREADAANARAIADAIARLLVASARP